MKKFLIGTLLFMAGMLSATGSMAQSANGGVFDVAYSTFGTRGVCVTTGTVVQINATRPTNFKARVAGYRIQNQDSADTIWIGGVSVTTHSTNNNATAIANLGEQVVPGETTVWPVFKDADADVVKLYAKAADAASTVCAFISVMWFGY